MKVMAAITDFKKKNKGSYEFIIRTLLFFAVVLIPYFIVFMWFRHTPFFLQHLRLDESYYIPWLTGLRKTDFLNAGIFAVIAFIIWNKKSIFKLKSTKRNQKETIIFASLTVFSFVAHYAWKALIKYQPDLMPDLLFSVFKYAFIVVFFVLAFITAYTLPFTKWFTKKYKQSLLTFAGVGIVYFFLIQLFQKIWYSLSYMVAKSVVTLLSITSSDVFFSAGSKLQGPRIGAEGFRVGISDACSGIDSLLLFLSLFAILFILDYKRMHTKRMWLALIPGILITVAYNILRIYLLMLVGMYIDPDFAVDTFHSNIGWILFLVFFVLYWHFTSKWVYKKKSTGQKRKE